MVWWTLHCPVLSDAHPEAGHGPLLGLGQLLLLARVRGEGLPQPVSETRLNIGKDKSSADFGRNKAMGSRFG